jgi:hypothetical protein
MASFSERTTGRGMQKFLEIAWSSDRECGEANYEMEGDTRQGMLLLPDGGTGFKKRKVEVFQERLAGLIERGELATDKAVFLHCLINGFLPRVAKDVYTRLTNCGLLKNLRKTYPRYSDAAMKEPRKIEV